MIGDTLGRLTAPSRHRPRALLHGTFDPSHTRNRVMVQLLESAGWEVVQLHRDLWGSERFSVATDGRFRLAVRAVVTYFRLVAGALRLRKPDAVFFLYPGHVDMLLLAPVWRLRRVPVVFDPLLSLHDTLVVDRGLVRDGSPGARAVAAVDRAAFRLATQVIVDSPEVGEHYAQRYGAPPERLLVIRPSTDVDALGPPADGPGIDGRVLFHGTFIALHGIDTIVRAAALSDPGLDVVLIGRGQESVGIEALVAELGGVPNLRILPPMPMSDLGDEIRCASVCLGIFSRNPKAGRVVPFKVFEYLALGRPVITGDTPAARHALGDAVVLVPPGDPEALARALAQLVADPDRRTELARRGRELFEAEFAPAVLARELGRALDGLLGTAGPGR